MPTPITMSYEEWMNRTRLGITAIRSPKFCAVDRILNEYNRIPTEVNQVRLRKALMDLITAKGFEALKTDPRNGNNAIEDLFAQVVLGRQMMPFALKSELLKVMQERIKGQIFGGDIQQTDVGPSGEITRRTIRKVGHLGESDMMLRIVAEQIERGLDCRISYGPVKSLESASRKVHDDYSGDWYQLKDGVRVTVIATNEGRLTGVGPAKLEAAKKKIEAVFVPSNGLTLIKNEETLAGTPEKRPKDNPCGYSGLNLVVRLRNGGESGMTGWNFPALSSGWPGEIQANIPAMMYGKMSAKNLCSMFDQDGYDSLKSELGVEGGISHVFYEIWREDRSGPNGLAAAALGGRYHDYLRNPLGSEKDRLTADISAFKRATPVNTAKFGTKH